MKNLSLKILLSALLLSAIQSLQAQNDIAFYSLGDATPQSLSLNAAFHPNSRFYISLPVISGFHIGVNNGFSYSDLFQKVPGEDAVTVEGDKFLKNLKNRSYLNMTSNISLLQAGVTLPAVGSFSFFVNERISGGFTYPKKTFEFIWEGNGAFVDQDFVEDETRVQFNHFREFGLGFAKSFNISDRPLTAGIRLKMLQGIFNAESDKDFELNIATQQDRFFLDITTQNPEFRTAGFDVFDNGDEGSYIAGNANKGFAVDLGGTYSVNENIDVSLAINDLGSITWKEHVKNYTVTNTSITFEGLDISDLEDFGEALIDTLESKFNDETNTESYTSGISPRSFVGGSYLLGNNRLSLTLSNYFQAGRTQTGIGAAYTRKFGPIKVSGTLSKLPQQIISVGGAFSLDLGAYQMYFASDNLFGLSDLTKTQNASFRFGMNLVFGSSKEPKSKKSDVEIKI
ncbi:MAG: DUF5723 family protein [Cyclobacteriaceae bacterium]